MENKGNSYVCPCCGTPMRADFQQNLRRDGGYWLFTCDNHSCKFEGFTLTADCLDELVANPAKLAGYTDNRRVS